MRARPEATAATATLELGVGTSQGHDRQRGLVVVAQDRCNRHYIGSTSLVAGRLLVMFSSVVRLARDKYLESATVVNVSAGAWKGPNSSMLFCVLYSITKLP